MNFLEGDFFWLELHSLLLNERDHIEATSMKEAMMKGVEEFLAKAFELPSRTTYIDMKSAIFCFLEMDLINMVRHWILDTILMKSFDRPSYSDAFMNALVDKLNWNSAMAQVPDKLTGRIAVMKIEGGV